MKKAILMLAAMAVSASAVAGPSWTYLDFGYGRSSSGDEDSDGYIVRGSLGFAEVWHAELAYTDAEIRGGRSSGGSDFDGYTITFGANPAVNDTTDLVFDVIYFDGDVEAGSTDGIDGYGLGVGLRTMWTEALELNAGIDVLSGEQDSSGDFTDVVVAVGGNYAFNDNLVLGIEVANGAQGVSGNTGNFYARFQF